MEAIRNGARGMDDLRLGVHDAEQPRRVERTRHSGRDGDDDAARDRLHCRQARALRVLLADAARNGGGRRHAEPDPDAEDQDQQRFRQPDGRN